MRPPEILKYRVRFMEFITQEWDEEDDTPARIDIRLAVDFLGRHRDFTIPLLEERKPLSELQRYLANDVDPDWVIQYVDKTISFLMQIQYDLVYDPKVSWDRYAADLINEIKGLEG